MYDVWCLFTGGKRVHIFPAYSLDKVHERIIHKFVSIDAPEVESFYFGVLQVRHQPVPQCVDLQRHGTPGMYFYC